MASEITSDEVHDKNILEMRGITKLFPGVRANDEVDLIVEDGEIHALVGENGAGKTTLMKILYGMLEADAGKIFYNGQEVDIEGPQDAINLGIGMVHQHFKLVDTLTVTENIILGSEPRKGLSINVKKAKKRVEEISEKFGLHVDPDAKIQDIPVGMQQRVEIIKILYRGADLLVFDEPTAVLTPQEIDELFEIFRSLKEEGKTMIFITHKLQEVKKVTDSITVLRDGKSVGRVKTENVSQNEVAEMMVGREVLFDVEKKKASPGEKILEVERLHVNDNRGIEAVSGISFSIDRGEIFGVAGVEGNGQTELVEALTGLREIESGSVNYKGEDITGIDARQIKDRKIAHIPEDRQRRGLILDFDLAENMILGYQHQTPFSRNGLMNYERIYDNAEALIEEFDVRTSSFRNSAGKLSGGNQQKAVIAREFSRNPELLIASQPTRGVDVGSIEFIHEQLVKKRDEGVAVLLVSAELSEIISLSDRIGVIFDGELVKIMKTARTDERELGKLMTGGTVKEAD
ncbi:ABC transporter ATP-binding protein [Halarsenatibacter silvermanii]|uniref:Nucleoside ABC transporter ATP-binding protein n=1 Tax=Halarsenatibacter silvermanii TaxID=321763 RepID=A0A1G9NI95_9FIRM|nr:ABC transporter ATP-binding protein [Halarsenatibacter silvermanii]SDL86326.1 nucleoside ABC transporter ATP-binding protein [Halarsenatibacter silvermanii]